MKHIGGPKILHGIYDCTVSPTLPHCDFTATGENDFKLVKQYCKYDMRKYFFTQRNIINSCSVNSFKTKIDKRWRSQDVYYDYRCDIAEAENRSNSNK